MRVENPRRARDTSTTHHKRLPNEPVYEGVVFFVLVGVFWTLLLQLSRLHRAALGGWWVGQRGQPWAALACREQTTECVGKFCVSNVGYRGAPVRRRDAQMTSDRARRAVTQSPPGRSTS